MPGQPEGTIPPTRWHAPPSSLSSSSSTCPATGGFFLITIVSGANAMSNSPQPPQTSSTIQRASEGTVDGLLAATFRGNGNATVDETAARPQAPTSPPANTGSEHRAPPIAAAEPVAAGDGNKNGRSNLAQPSPGSGLVTNALAALRGAANHAGGERTENGLSDEQMALLRSKASSSTVLEDVSEELS